MLGSPIANFGPPLQNPHTPNPFNNLIYRFPPVLSYRYPRQATQKAHPRKRKQERARQRHLAC